MHKKINISSKDKIEEAITTIVTRYVNEANAEAVYMNNFYSLSINEPVIELVAVFKNQDDYLIDIDNSAIIDEIYKETGITISIMHKFTCEYTYTLLDAKERARAQDLKNGYLLYDKTGEFKELKNYLTYKNREALLPRYINSVTFNPPLKLKKIKNSVINSSKKEEI